MDARPTGLIIFYFDIRPHADGNRLSGARWISHLVVDLALSATTVSNAVFNIIAGPPDLVGRSSISTMVPSHAAQRRSNAGDPSSTTVAIKEPGASGARLEKTDHRHPHRGPESRNHRDETLHPTPLINQSLSTGGVSNRGACKISLKQHAPCAQAAT